VKIRHLNPDTLSKNPALPQVVTVDGPAPDRLADDRPGKQQA
jgi:hypothetical protein